MIWTGSNQMLILIVSDYIQKMGKKPENVKKTRNGPAHPCRWQEDDPAEFNGLMTFCGTTCLLMG
jgi:hypothetical protein